MNELFHKPVINRREVKRLLRKPVSVALLALSLCACAGQVASHESGRQLTLSSQVVDGGGDDATATDSVPVATISTLTNPQKTLVASTGTATGTNTATSRPTGSNTPRPTGSNTPTEAPTPEPTCPPCEPGEPKASPTPTGAIVYATLTFTPSHADETGTAAPTNTPPPTGTRPIICNTGTPQPTSGATATNAPTPKATDGHGAGACLADKIGNYDEERFVDGTRVELAGTNHERQHASLYIQHASNPNVRLEVSFIIDKNDTRFYVCEVNGSMWAFPAPECDTYDIEADARNYVLDRNDDDDNGDGRPDRHHSGLVYDWTDFVAGRGPLVNIYGIPAGELPKLADFQCQP